jgi:hypothetical protein
MMKMVRWCTISIVFMIFIGSQQVDARVLKRAPIKTPVAGIGVEFGGASSISDDAVDGFPYTEFNSGFLYGGSFIVFMPNNLGNSMTPMGIGFEIGISKFDMDLQEQAIEFDSPGDYYGNLNLDFGTLEVMPLTFLLRLQQFPTHHRPFGFNFDVGFGIFFSDFSKGNVLKELEIENLTRYSIETDHATFFQIGAGTDFYLAPQISLSFRAKFLIGNIGTSWDVPVEENLALSTIDQFNVSTMQYMAGLRVWF